jgi:hypothetical protein
LLDGWGERRKAWEIARGKRTWETRQLYDLPTRTQQAVGVLALPVNHREHARPLYRLRAALGRLLSAYPGSMIRLSLTPG